MLSLHFPVGVLYDLSMRGGPLPERYENLGCDLLNSGPLEFEPEEALEIVEWLEEQPDDLVDDATLDAAVELVDRALRLAQLCSECGGAFTVKDDDGDSFCARCGEPSES